MNTEGNKKGIGINDESLEKILDTFDSAVFLLDQSKDVLKYNKAFLKMFNFTIKLNSNKCFKSIDIGSKKSGVEYFKLRFKEEDEDDESKKCVLNVAIKKAMDHDQATENQIVGDEYFIDGKAHQLYLKFSVKPIELNKKKYVIATIDDISDFENAKLKLLKNNIKIKRYNYMYKKELKMARKVQSSILPKKLFLSDNFKIDFRYFPLGEIGGDFFDFIKIDDSHIGVLLCDVAGHGVPSALITTMIKAMLESSRAFYLSPKKLVKYINNQIIKIFGDCFLTMIYGVIDKMTGIFTYVRAGHPKPWLLSNKAISTMGIKNNLMLGVDEKLKFEEDSVFIDKGSKLILFTDGLTDIGRKNSGYENEISKLLKEISEQNPDIILDKIEENIKKRLKDEKHQDDICVIVVERLLD